MDLYLELCSLARLLFPNIVILQVILVYKVYNATVLYISIGGIVYGYILDTNILPKNVKKNINYQSYQNV